MSSVPYPAELRRTKQPVPTDKLVRWAEESGFETRRSGGGTSHIVCQHSVHRDIVFKIIAGSDLPDSQQDFAKALTLIEKRELGLQRDFANAARRNIEDAYVSLPAYLAAEHDFEKGHTVVRDRAMPQIGVTIPFAQAHMLENKIRNILEPVKRELCVLLNRARMTYDIDTGYERGHFDGVLGHPIYDIGKKTVAPYQADDAPARAIAEVFDYINLVQATDDAHETRLASLLSNHFVGAAKIVYQARRGERTNILPLAKPDGGTFLFKFETASNRRADAGDIHAGRITEMELSRVEKTIGGLAFAHGQAPMAKIA